MEVAPLGNLRKFDLLCIFLYSSCFSWHNRSQTQHRVFLDIIKARVCSYIKKNMCKTMFETEHAWVYFKILRIELSKFY